MVDRQVGRGHGLPAVLTHAIVAEEKVTSVGAQHPAGDLDVGEEPDDNDILTKATAFDSQLDSLPSGVVYEGDALLGQQDDQPPLTDYVQRLK